jgi:hypothetical protein
MGKRNHTPKTDSGQRTPNKRRPARSRQVTSSVPEDIVTDRGYLALQVSGLSDLLGSAAAEEPLSPEAVFFVATALDDVAGKLSR